MLQTSAKLAKHSHNFVDNKLQQQRRDVEMDKEILDIRAAANFLGIKKRTMYKLVNEGEIPAKKIGGQWRFSKSQLISLFEKNGNNGGYGMAGDEG